MSQKSWEEKMLQLHCIRSRTHCVRESSIPIPHLLNHEIAAQTEEKCRHNFVDTIHCDIISNILFISFCNLRFSSSELKCK